MDATCPKCYDAVIPSATRRCPKCGFEFAESAYRAPPKVDRQTTAPLKKSTRPSKRLSGHHTAKSKSLIASQSLINAIVSQSQASQAKRKVRRQESLRTGYIGGAGAGGGSSRKSKSPGPSSTKATVGSSRLGGILVRTPSHSTSDEDDSDSDDSSSSMDGHKKGRKHRDHLNRPYVSTMETLETYDTIRTMDTTRTMSLKQSIRTNQLASFVTLYPNNRPVMNGSRCVICVDKEAEVYCADCEVPLCLRHAKHAETSCGRKGAADALLCEYDWNRRKEWFTRAACAASTFLILAIIAVLTLVTL